MNKKDHLRLSGVRAALLVTASFAVFAAAPAHAATQKVTSDPFEGLNRAFFGLNAFLDRVFFRPAALTYKHVMPRPIRKGLDNAISNLGEPAIAVNDGLQGHGLKAAKTLARFASNTTFGLAGLFDVATPSGLPHHKNDFGITLARYGVKPGPYLFVPLIGPSTVRDAFGGAAGLVLNPLVYARYPEDDVVGAVSVIAGGLQARADADGDLKTIYASATDPYASIRSLYLQNRQSEVTGGKLDIQALPDFDETSPSSPAAAPAPVATTSPPDAAANASPTDPAANPKT